MFKKTLLVLSALAFAAGILLISFFRTAETRYSFNPMAPADVANVLGNEESRVDYPLPYPGSVLPDNPLWQLKAFRDRLWIMVNASPTKDAELLLLFADKRLGSAKLLIDKGNIDAAVSTLGKSEKYLEEAYIKAENNRAEGFETDDFLYKLALSSLKHYEVINYILYKAPDNARPQILESREYSQKVYKNVNNMLINNGLKSPENPFNW